MKLPTRGLKKIAYYRKNGSDGKRFITFRYYIWTVDRWRLISYYTFLHFLYVLNGIHNISDAFFYEEYELETALF
jgi:hypothetical protein